MGKSKREQQLLDFAAAEGSYREKLSTLGNVAKVVGATCLQANVLRFVFEEGGLHRSVDLVLPRIAGSPWIQASENTVRKALAFWEGLAIIEMERDRRDGNRQAPNAARLCWSSILQRLLGGGYSVSPQSADSEGRRDGADPRFSASSFEPPASSFEPPASSFEPPASSFEPPASSFDSLKPPFSRNPIRVRACAHGLLSLSSVCTVVDDVSTDRSASFSEIWRLAEKARRPIYQNWPRDSKAKETFVAGAVLAAMLFSERWLMAATTATQVKSGAMPWRYWIGCLRNGLTEIEGLQPLGTREEAASYFATLMNAALPIALQVIAEHGGGQPVAAAVQSRDPSIFDATPDELAEARAGLDVAGIKEAMRRK